MWTDSLSKPFSHPLRADAHWFPTSSQEPHPQLVVYEDRILGSGSENVVCEGELGGEKVAVSTPWLLRDPVKYGINSKEDVEDLYENNAALAVRLREVDTHSMLTMEKGIIQKILTSGLSGKHDFQPNLVRFKGLFWDELLGVPVPKYTVMEHCNGGTLEQRLTRSREAGRNPLLEPREVCDIIHTLVGALESIHSSGHCHRDIKPANILFHDGVVKIADFGFARKVDKKAMSKVGTPLYMAPEVATGKYDQSADVYSLAIVAMEMAGASPESLAMAKKQAERGATSQFQRLIDTLSEDKNLYLKTLLQTVLKAPADRPSSSQLLIRASLGTTSAIVPVGTSVGRWMVPEVYVCQCCDDGCPYSDEPADDKEWQYCLTCEDGMHCWDSRCFQAFHRFKNKGHHEHYTLPLAAPVKFGDVVDKLLLSEQMFSLDVVRGVTKMFALEGGEVLVDVAAKEAMVRIAEREIAGGFVPGFVKDALGFRNTNCVSEYKQWIQNGNSVRLGYSGVVVNTAEGGSTCLSDACKDRVAKQSMKVTEVAKRQTFSAAALQSSMAMSLFFAAAEIGYNLYQQWGREDISWKDFRTQSYEVVIGHATAGVASWAGASLAVGLVGTFVSGSGAIFLAAAFGGIVCGALGQYAGRKEFRRRCAKEQFNDENARAIVSAMDALDIWVDDPKDLALDQVRETYLHMSRQIHPDKVHQKDGENDKQFQERKAAAHVRMSLINHHYKVLKAYIEFRDKSRLWESVPVGEAWKQKQGEKQLRLVGP